MKKIFFLFLLLFPAIFVAQVEFSAGQINKQFNPKFYIDFLNYSLSPFQRADSLSKSKNENKTKVSVVIQVPYASVQFKKNAKGYFAKYSVSLTFFDKLKKKIILEKLWNERIFTRNYKQTFSKNNFNISFRSLNLKPDEYTVVCVIEDQNSSNPISFQHKIKVRNFGNTNQHKKHVEISDVIFVKKRIRTNGRESIVPNVAHIFSPGEKTIELYYEIYSDKARTVNIQSVIKDLNRDKFFKKTETVKLKIGKNPISSFLKEPELSLGNFNLVIKVVDKENTILAGIKNKFIVSIPNLPSSSKGLANAIKQMKYIAGPSALDSIENAPSYDERLKLFLAFWKNRDPDPATVENEVMAEYYRRVEYANKNFKSYTDGWNTDRGMVFITLGPPDQVERQPVAIDTKPYEIWRYYNLNKEFFFQDETGFGDYRLLNPQYGEWNRYRQ